MSQVFTQDWEAAPSSPWEINGSHITRTNSSPMEGSWDIRLATTSGSGTWLLALTAPARTTQDSRRGLLVQARFTFMLEVAPSGGQILTLFRLNELPLLIPNASQTLRLGSDRDLSFTDDPGGALTLNQQYLVDVEYRFERDTGVWMRCWLDGAFRFDHRDGAGSQPLSGVVNFATGGNPSGKGTVTARWGDMTVWVGQDAS